MSDGNDDDQGPAAPLPPPPPHPHCLGRNDGRCFFRNNGCIQPGYMRTLRQAIEIAGKNPPIEPDFIKLHYPPSNPASACTLAADLGLAQNRSLDGLRPIDIECHFSVWTVPITATGRFLQLPWRGAFQDAVQAGVPDDMGCLDLAHLRTLFGILSRRFFQGTLERWVRDNRGRDLEVSLSDIGGFWAETDPRGPCIRFFPSVWKTRWPGARAGEFEGYPRLLRRRGILLDVMQTVAHEIVHLLMEEPAGHDVRFAHLSYVLFGATTPQMYSGPRCHTTLTIPRIPWTADPPLGSPRRRLALGILSNASAAAGMGAPEGEDGPDYDDRNQELQDVAKVAESLAGLLALADKLKRGEAVLLPPEVRGLPGFLLGMRGSPTLDEIREALAKTPEERFRESQLLYDLRTVLGAGSAFMKYSGEPRFDLERGAAQFKVEVDGMYYRARDRLFGT